MMGSFTKKEHREAGGANVPAFVGAVLNEHVGEHNASIPAQRMCDRARKRELFAFRF
jgi:hypothetical protein